MKVKLTYTDEMKEQDTMWDNESENLNTMKSLQEQIVDEAKGKGWEGVAVFWMGGNESLVDIADTQENHDNGNYVESFGNCRGLIKRIEEDLNRNKLLQNTVDH